MIKGCQGILILYYQNTKQLFWYFKWPESNVEFWRNKLTENRRRDVVKIQALKELDWKVIVVWECELKGDNQTTRLNKLYLEITQREQKT